MLRIWRIWRFVLYYAQTGAFTITTTTQKFAGLMTPVPSALGPLHTAFSNMLDAVNRKLGGVLLGPEKELVALLHDQQLVASQLEPLLLAEFLALISRPSEDGRRLRAAMLRVLSEVESPEFDIKKFSVFTGSHALSVAEQDEMLSSEEAARLLNVSRTHVNKLIDEGLIAGAEKTEGRHRRVPKAAVLAYKRASKVKQSHGLAQMVEASERMGLYDAERAAARKKV